MTARNAIAAAAAVLVLLSGCVADPEVAPGRSAVYGVLTARPHSELVAKWTHTTEGRYGGMSDRVLTLPENAIDYARLTDLYVGLADPAYAGGAVHEVTFAKAGASPESLAVAVGDVIRIRNRTAAPLTFFLAATESEAFQDGPMIAAGETGEVRVAIEGLLELAADEDERLVAPVLARRGLRTARVASGGRYEFNGLAPGGYRLTFWYWRLGSIERMVTLTAGQAMRIDEVLAVDRTVR